MLWKKKITWDSCSDLRFKQRLLQTSVDVFLRFTAKLLYFRLNFMFRQIRTKKIFIKELFKPRNTTFIKYEGRWHLGILINQLSVALTQEVTSNRLLSSGGMDKL